MQSRALTTTIADLNETPLTLKAMYFAPADPTPDARIFFALPGGGSDRNYFDLGTFEGFDYSFASRLTAMGHHVITMDHPGTGENALPESHPFLTPRQSADYISTALPDFIELTSVGDLPLLCVGHSMGGMMAVLLEGRHQLFDGLCLFGSSAGGLDWGLDDHEKTYIDRPEAFEADLESLTLRKFQTAFPPGMAGPSGKSITFGGQNEAINNRLKEVATGLFAAGGMTSMVRGSFKHEAEAVTVPMFLAFGDHDIGIPPRDTLAAFTGCTDFHLLVLENTGHNSFAFESLAGLCTQVNDWSAKIEKRSVGG